MANYTIIITEMISLEGGTRSLKIVKIINYSLIEQLSLLTDIITAIYIIIILRVIKAIL